MKPVSQRVCARLNDLEQAVERGTAGISFTAFTIRHLIQSQANLHDATRLQSLLIRSGTHTNTFIANLMLHLYSNLGSSQHAQAVFENIRKRNVFSWSIMLAAYAHSGHLLKAKSLFEKFPHRDPVSCTTMLAALTRSGYSKQALQLFAYMELEGDELDEVAYMTALDACEGQLELLKGKCIHEGIVSRGAIPSPFVGNALVTMYGRCGDVGTAKLVFDRMVERSVKSWTAMLTANAINGEFLCAEEVFGRMPLYDLVAYNAMLGSFSQSGELGKALRLFRLMKKQGVEPDTTTHSALVFASRVSYYSIAVPEVEAIRSGDLFLSTALVDFYGKRGCLEDAAGVFESSRLEDTVAWNAMISASAHSGDPQRVQELFSHLQLNGFTPDRVTFVSLLSAYSHAGMQFHSLQCFWSLQMDYQRLPELDHFKCMIDLLARLGQLCEAEEMLTCMPFDPDASSWKSLLSACAMHSFNVRT